MQICARPNLGHDNNTEGLKMDESERARSYIVLQCQMEHTANLRGDNRFFGADRVGFPGDRSY
jgi:hypothetical protein